MQLQKVSDDNLIKSDGESLIKYSQNICTLHFTLFAIDAQYKFVLVARNLYYIIQKALLFIQILSEHVVDVKPFIYIKKNLHHNFLAVGLFQQKGQNMAMLH